MPSYSYKCEVCSTRVDEGNEYCPICGCPAVRNLNELNWFKEKWAASDKSKPIVYAEKRQIPFCVFTSIGVLLTGFWYYFIAPTKGTSGDLYSMFIAVSISFPLSIIGVINGKSHLHKKENKTRSLTVTCMVFSSIAVFVSALPILLVIVILFRALIAG